MNADDLNAMTFDEFRRLVERDVKRQLGLDDTEVPALLRSPAVVERWCAALSALLRSVEGQLASQRADMYAKVEYFRRKYEASRENLRDLQERGVDDVKLGQARERMRGHASKMGETRQTFWEDRVKKLRFRTGVSEVFCEAVAIRDQLDQWARLRAVTEERNALAVDLRALRKTVAQHRDWVLDGHDSLSDDEIDDRLWSAAGVDVMS